MLPVATSCGQVIVQVGQTGTHCQAVWITDSHFAFGDDAVRRD